MKHIRRHSVYYILGTFLVCAASGYYFPSGIRSSVLIISSLLTLTAAIVAAAIFLRRRARSVFAPVFTALIFCAAAAASGSSFLYYDVKYASISALAGSETEIEAVVIKRTYYGSSYSCYDINILRAGNKKINAGAKLFTGYASDIGENERFIMRVMLDSADRDDPDTARYNLSKGFMLYAESAQNSHINLGDNGFSLRYMFSRMNSYASEKIKLWIGEKEGGYVSSLALGSSGDAPPELRRDISRLGLSHILAVSGMHLTITLGMAGFILERLSIHRRVIDILLIIITLLYMGLTGFSPSVVRCALMTILYYSLLLFGERADRVSSLLIAASAVCLINPPSAIDIGLILSFSATLGLITAGAFLGRLIGQCLPGRRIPVKILRYFLGDMASGFCAVLFTLPFAWSYYGEFAPASVLLNLLFSPLASLTLLLAPVFIVSCFFDPAAAAIAFVLRRISALFIASASFFARGADYTVSLRYGFVKYIAVLYIVFTLMLLLGRAKKVCAIILPPFVCAAVFGVCLIVFGGTKTDISDIYYYNYKLNDGIAVVSGGELLICDISDGSYGITRTGCDIGRENHIKDVGVYMLTHYHNRHINTLIKLSSWTYLKTICLPVPENKDEQEIFSILSSIAAKHHCSVSVYPRKEKAAVMFGRMTVTFFDYTVVARSTHPVICVGMRDSDESILYLGGAVFESDNAGQLNESVAASDIVIVGAHPPKLKIPFRAGCAYVSGRTDTSLVIADKIAVVPDRVRFTFRD